MTQSQEFFTAGELAGIVKAVHLKGFPTSERSFRRLADQEGWNDLPTSLCRERRGREGGGGREYHFSILPGALQAVIEAKRHKAATSAAQEKRRETDRAVVKRMNEFGLRARQSAVMDKRAEVLAAIDRYMTVTGRRQGRAVADFIDAQADHAAWEAASAARDDCVALPPADVALLQRQSRLMAAEGGFGLTPETLRIANDRSGGGGKISRSQIYEWLRIRRDQGIAALAPATTKASEPVPPGFADFLRYYARPSKPTATEALAAYTENLTDPSLALTIDQVNYTLAVKLNHIERNVGRDGLLTLRSRMAYIQRDTSNLWPTTIYTADGKTFDAEIADPVSRRPMRPEITSILDVATRKCVGFAISRKENVMAVTEALRNACVDHGICAIFYTDRGAGYKNRTLDGRGEDETRGLMARLEITKMHALPYNSQAKGIIERFNRTCWNGLARSFPTYLGDEMDKEARQFAHRRSRADLKEFGHSKLLMPWDDFRQACLAAIDTYNATPHSGLARFEDPETGRIRHMSPNEAWAAHVASGFEPVTVEADLVDDLFRPYVPRKVSRNLVKWNTNDFYHEALERYHEQTVLVGYDDAQANRVWVREIDRASGEPGALICVAEFGGNRVDYIPRTLQAAAEKKREEGRLRRIDRKRQDIEAERNAPFQLERDAFPPPVFIDPMPEPVPAPPVSLVVDNAAPSEPPKRRRTFATDEDLAVWALEHRDELTPNQIRVLRACVNSPAHCEVFRLSGIDVEALRTLLRVVA